MKFKLTKTLYTFDKSVNAYLLFLVSIQQGSKLSAIQKSDIFVEATLISQEVDGLVQGLLSGRNQFNLAERANKIEIEFKKLNKKIRNEIKKYLKDVKIDENALLLYNDIIENLSKAKNGIALNINKIMHLLSYKELTKDNELKKTIDKELDELKEKSDKELYLLKLKTFLESLHGNNNENPKIFFKVNNFILKKIQENVPTQFLKTNPENLKDDILYFILNGKEINIKFKTHISFIDYSIKFIDDDINNNSFIHIVGSIFGKETTKTGCKDRRTTFKVYEKYTNCNILLNTYNIIKIIEKINDLTLEFYRNIENDTKDNDDDDGWFDDLLDGKIK